VKLERGVWRRRVQTRRSANSCLEKTPIPPNLKSAVPDPGCIQPVFQRVTETAEPVSLDRRINSCRIPCIVLIWMSSHSPGLPRLAATLGDKTPSYFTLKGLRHSFEMGFAKHCQRNRSLHSISCRSGSIPQLVTEPFQGTTTVESSPKVARSAHNLGL
jgi:hypothetical protein